MKDKHPTSGSSFRFKSISSLSNIILVAVAVQKNFPLIPINIKRVAMKVGLSASSNLFDEYMRNALMIDGFIIYTLGLEKINESFDLMHDKMEPLL